MINFFRGIFKGRSNDIAKKYSGFSDFFLNASEEEKKRVITEAARKANEDQLRVFNEARLKMKDN